MLKNIYGEEIYREETMDEEEFQNNILWEFKDELYPKLDDDMITELVLDLMVCMSGKEYLEFQAYMGEKFRRHKNLERRKQRELKKQQQLEKEAI